MLDDPSRLNQRIKVTDFKQKSNKICIVVKFLNQEVCFDKRPFIAGPPQNFKVRRARICPSISIVQKKNSNNGFIIIVVTINII